jgi:AAA+ ATPase superfamily predicted ATPase
MDLIINRKESSSLDEGWTLLYGRRKTGKTYVLNRFFRSDIFVLVGREGTIWIKGDIERKITSADEMADMVKDELSKGKKVVIDEFQRLPSDTMEWISTVHPTGQLIISGSSMSVVKKVLDRRSPLLGKFKVVKLSLLDPGDLLKGLPQEVPLDFAPYLSDPWTIPFLRNERILEQLLGLISGTSYTVPALIGEIFHEEDRILSEIYQGILTSIGSGRMKPIEIASLLYAKGLIKQESVSQISPYLVALKDMGIIEPVGIYGKKREVLRLISQMFNLYYYMESKYGLERGTPSFSEARDNLARIHSICMERYLVKAYAEKMGGVLNYSFDPEIDGIVVNRKGHPLSVIEVKWTDLRKRDIDAFLDKTASFECKKIILTKKEVEVFDDDIVIQGERTIRKYLKNAMNLNGSPLKKEQR